jgi:nucleolin
MKRPLKVGTANDRDAREEAPAELGAWSAHNTGTAASSSPEEEVVSTRVFLGNLSFKIDEEILGNVFKECGTVKEVEMVNDKKTGKFYGSAFCEFTTAEAATKALALNGQQVLGRAIKIGPAKAKPIIGFGGGAPRDDEPLGKKPKGCKTLFLGNLSFDVDDDSLRAHFAACGTVHQIRFVERNGQFNGCGFLEFETTQAVDKALELQGSDLLGRSVRIDFAGAK